MIDFTVTLFNMIAKSCSELSIRADDIRNSSSGSGATGAIAPVLLFQGGALL